MWIFKAPLETYGNLNGELFDHEFTNNICTVLKQYYYVFFKRLGFEDITPDELRSIRIKNPERIMLVHYGGVGDVLMLLPIAEAIKSEYPKCHITVSTRNNSAQLLFNNKYIDSFKIDDQQRVPHYLDQYDDVICLDTIIAGNELSSITEIHDLLEEWGGYKLKNKLGTITLLKQELDQVDKIFETKYKIKETDKIVTIQIASTSPIRNPNLLTILLFINKLLDDGYKVFVFGSDKPIENYIIKQCDKCNEKVISFVAENVKSMSRYCTCGNLLEFSFPEDRLINSNNLFNISSIGLRNIAAVISKSDYFIGPDSCGLHIAGIFDVPCLGIFSSFDSDLRMRYIKRKRYIQKKYRCAPCFLHSSICRWKEELKLNTVPCLNQITEDEIYNEFIELTKENYKETNNFIKGLTDITSRRCPVCNSIPEEFVGRKGEILYLQCQNCNLVFTNKKLDSLGYYSDIDYYNVYITDGYREAKRNQGIELLNRFKEINSFLEIGCGLGDIVKVFKEAGKISTGIEISSSNRRFHEEEKIDIIYGDFENDDIKLDKYDLILLDNSFEHFYNPIPVMEKLKKILTDSGKICIVMPNTKYFDKMNNTWGHLNTYVSGEHCCLYGKRSLEELNKRTGFSIATYKDIEQSNSLEIILERSIYG